MFKKLTLCDKITIAMAILMIILSVRYTFNEYNIKLKINTINNIKEASILIENITIKAGGSGTHIKINKKDYILTTAHLIHEKSDFLWAVFDNGDRIPLELIKINKESDLALFRIQGIEKIPYLKISKNYPIENDDITVIGNPNLIEDIFTKGNICKFVNNGFLYTNKTFFGNSGGCVIYKGKVVGVVSKLITIGFYPSVNYGFAIGLYEIKEFLKDVG